MADPTPDPRLWGEGQIDALKDAAAPAGVADGVLNTVLDHIAAQQEEIERLRAMLKALNLRIRENHEWLDCYASVEAAQDVLDYLKRA